MGKYKDACDSCGKFDFCKGHGGKVLCPSCITIKEKDDGKQNPTP